MRSLAFLLSLSLAASAVPTETESSDLPYSLRPRAVCDGNTASTRTQWCDYDINTDWYNEVPETGVTREYWFELTDVTVSPDGVSRSAQAINGSIPGPTIFADWGDTVVVHLTNALRTSANGTSIHFHGIRQNQTNQHDGVCSITQCPTAVGQTITYTWRATQYGSTWYHSHFALQAWQGVFGGIVINGPASADYDEDLGVLFLNDWDHSTVNELWPEAEASGPPTLASGLINGTNVYGDDGSDGQTGERFALTLAEGTSYRLRLVNGALDTHFRFSIDNHTLTVMAADLVPVEPYDTTAVSIGMGQRYDVVVTADQAAVANRFWMRAIPQSACSDNANPDNIKGIVYYGDADGDDGGGLPETTAYDYTDSCEDEAAASLVPVVGKTVGSTATTLEDVTVGTNADGMFRWYLNSTTMVVDWANPTLLQMYSNETGFSASNAVLSMPAAAADGWVVVVVQTALAVPHPIHLHGHDFFIVGQGTGSFDDDDDSSAASLLQTDNPPRRDTAMLPASGYLALAFQTDNPGAWLMHCHIGWHTSEGFAIQFVVRQDEAVGLLDADLLTGQCDAWSEYVATETVEQDDSGI